MHFKQLNKGGNPSSKSMPSFNFITLLKKYQVVHWSSSDAGNSSARFSIERGYNKLMLILFQMSWQWWGEDRTPFKLESKLKLMWGGITNAFWFIYSCKYLLVYIQWCIYFIFLITRGRVHVWYVRARVCVCRQRLCVYITYNILYAAVYLGVSTQHLSEGWWHGHLYW